MTEAEQRFLAALLALMQEHGARIDHNHDAEALGDGWHWRGAGFGSHGLTPYAVYNAQEKES